MVKWQAIVFVFACLRIFLVNFLDLSNEELGITSELNAKALVNNMYTLGILFFGNLIDNSASPKIILLICESFIALSYLTQGVSLYAYFKETNAPTSEE